MKRILEFYPNLVEVKTVFGQKKYIINYDITEKEYNLYECSSVFLPPSVLDYGKIVNLILKEKYPDGQMEAVLYNYLLDSDNETIIKEYNEVQEYRKIAKQIAKEALQYITNNI